MQPLRPQFCNILLRQFSPSQVELESCFQLDRFDSLLLPQNNRPLEPSVLLVLKELFNRSNANTTALHMLSVDCQVVLSARNHQSHHRNQICTSNISRTSTHQCVAYIWFGTAGSTDHSGNWGAEDDNGSGIGAGAHYFASRTTTTTGFVGKVHAEDMLGTNPSRRLGVFLQFLAGMPDTPVNQKSCISFVLF